MLASFLSLAAACGKSETSKPTAVPTATLPGGQNATSTPSPTPLGLPSQPRIENLLSRVPLEFADLPVGFGDWVSARSVQAGIESDDPIDSRKLVESYEESKRAIYEGLQPPPVEAFRMNINLIGLEEPGSVFFDLGIWFYTSNPSGPLGAPHLLNMEGRLPQDQMVTALLELGYRELEYKDTTYYSLHEDYSSNPRHPLGPRGYPINRVAFMDDQFLAASATELITSLIDVQDGSAASLRESESHISLVRAAGDGLLAGVFFPHAEINRPSGVRISEKYLMGPDRWHALLPYDMTLTGYRLRNGVDEIVISLFYPDPLAADSDVAELVHRWETLTIDLSPENENFPVMESCGPLTTRVIMAADFSILEASCPVKRNPETNRSILENSHLWDLLQPEVLVQDPEAVAHVYETRPTPTPTPTQKPPDNVALDESPSDLEIGKAYDFEFGRTLHCGVDQIAFGGQFWRAEDVPEEWTYTRPVGWTATETRGKIKLLGEDVAVFTSQSGIEIRYVSLPEGELPTPCL